MRLSGIERRGDQGGPEALEEQEQDGDAHQAADDDGVADVGDRRADQQALVVDGVDLDAGRGALAPRRAARPPARSETASALPPSRRKTVSATASLPLDRIAVVRSSCPIITRPMSRSRIDWPFFSAMTTSSRSVGDVARVSASTWYCSAPRSSRPDRLEAVLLVQAVGHVGDREVGRDQGLGIDLDDDLADVAPLDGDVGDVRDAADPRPQVVIGVVVQLGWVASAGDDERDDREDRGRLPLGDRGGPLRELGADLGHAGADVVERLDHVGPGGEVDRQLGGPAHRLGPDPDHAQDDADDLLDRPGDGHLHVLDRQAGGLGDDDDPGEGDLGIDAAGHAEHRHDPEGGQQGRGQDDQPEVGPRPGDEVDAASRVGEGSAAGSTVRLMTSPPPVGPPSALFLRPRTRRVPWPRPHRAASRRPRRPRA